MMNIELNNDHLQGANVLLITPMDNQQKLVLCLSATDTGNVVVNLNNDECSNDNQKKKRVHEVSNSRGNMKRRKSDLMCVICEGSASGYNFNQIVCESCKAFFRRNAFQTIEKLKCLKNDYKNSNSIVCNIRYNIKHKCQRCRLLKCFELGMNKHRILTSEEKLLRQQRINENRHLRLMQNNNNEIKNTQNTTCESNVNISSIQSVILTEDDWTCLHHIQNAYVSALQSSPSASSVLPLEFPADRMSAYMSTIDIQNFFAMKVINFLKQIQEFSELHQSDRLLLVKYNLVILSSTCYAFKFDPIREIFYDDTLNDSISPAEEAFAVYSKSLYTLCYGYEFSCSVISLLHAFHEIINKDPLLPPLLLLNMIFLKGLSANDDQEPLINDNQRVFTAHSKYTNLLFRYLIEKSSIELATIKMMRITTTLIKAQKAVQNLHDFIKDKVDINYINPLMKSLFNLT